ncbi:unnamed protein product, partial [Vitis vinifera]
MIVTKIILLLSWPNCYTHLGFGQKICYILRQGKGLLISEAVVCGLEKHCRDSATTSPPIIAAAHRRQSHSPRQRTMSRR